MSPITHFLAGWAIANAARLERRERLLVTLASVIPDADGLGVGIDLFRQSATAPYEYYQKFHHVLFHNLFFGLMVAAAASLLAARKRAAGVLAFLSFHVHLLGDVVGSRGKGDAYWAFPYLSPFSDAEVVWSGQWPLNGWQNVVLTVVLMAASFFWAWKRAYSPIGLVSARADRVFVQALRKRFGVPAGA